MFTIAILSAVHIFSDFVVGHYLCSHMYTLSTHLAGSSTKVKSQPFFKIITLILETKWKNNESMSRVGIEDYRIEPRFLSVYHSELRLNV